MCVALCLALSLVELRRGSITALIDLVGMFVALRAAEYAYPYVISEALAPGLAYALVLGALVLLLIMISWHVQVATARLASPADFVVGALAGVMVGLALSYALFHFLSIEYGNSLAAYRTSMLRPWVHDLKWLEPLAKRLGVKLK